jgi:hypothetical protein
VNARAIVRESPWLATLDCRRLHATPNQPRAISSVEFVNGADLHLFDTKFITLCVLHDIL